MLPSQSVTARKETRKAMYPPCTRRETAPREARPEKLCTLHVQEGKQHRAKRGQKSSVQEGRQRRAKRGRKSSVLVLVPRRETAPRDARPQHFCTKKGGSYNNYGAKIVRKVMYHGVSCYLSRSSSNHICLLARRVLPPFLVRRFGTYIGFSTYVPARKILCNGNIDFSC